VTSFFTFQDKEMKKWRNKKLMGQIKTVQQDSSSPCCGVLAHVCFHKKAQTKTIVSTKVKGERIRFSHKQKRCAVV